jgi:MFS family permease
LASTALLLFGVTGAVSRWRAGVLADRMGSRLLFPAWLGAAASGLLAIAAGLLSGTTVPEVAPVLVGAALFGAGYRAVLNLSLLAAFARAGRDSTTTASAVWNASFDLGLGAGALGVGTVASAGLGVPWTYVVCVLLIVLTIPLLSAPPQREAPTRQRNRARGGFLLPTSVETAGRSFRHAGAAFGAQVELRRCGRRKERRGQEQTAQDGGGIAASRERWSPIR